MTKEPKLRTCTKCKGKALPATMFSDTRETVCVPCKRAAKKQK